MVRRLAGPIGVAVIGSIGLTLLSLAWLRSSFAEIAGKPVRSDRATKTEITPVRW